MESGYGGMYAIDLILSNISNGPQNLAASFVHFPTLMSSYWASHSKAHALPL
jgi:hypothetical protein